MAEICPPPPSPSLSLSLFIQPLSFSRYLYPSLPLFLSLLFLTTSLLKPLSFSTFSSSPSSISKSLHPSPHRHHTLFPPLPSLPTTQHLRDSRKGERGSVPEIDGTGTESEIIDFLVRQYQAERRHQFADADVDFPSPGACSCVSWVRAVRIKRIGRADKLVRPQADE